MNTQVLFVPYRGVSPGKAKSDAGSISQQKHAAREYHRKAKLKRLVQQTQTRCSDSDATSDAPDCLDEAGQHTESRDRKSRQRRRRPSPQSSTASNTPSPQSLLSAGRTDPFDSAPVKDLSPHVHQMIDYALNYQWPMFSFVNPGLQYEQMKEHIGSRLRVSQTSFYSVIYAAATHFALSRVGQPAPLENQMLRLAYKDRSLSLLLSDVRASGQSISDETLYAILAMTSYGSGTAEHIPPLKARNMRNPLAVTFDLDVYSRYASSGVAYERC
jgi:hypothetical protein